MATFTLANGFIVILEQFPTKLCLAANIFQIGHETTLDLSEDRALLFLFALVSQSLDSFGFTAIPGELFGTY